MDADTIQRLGQRYLDHPGDSCCKRAYREFEQWVEGLYESVANEVQIALVDYEPYGSFSDLVKDIRDRGRMAINTNGSDCPAYSNETRWKLQAWHDYTHHYKMRFSFEFEGELMAYLHARSLLPEGCHQNLERILFSRFVYQVAAYLVLNDFPPSDKVVLS